MERLSQVNNDQRWLMWLWYAGFALFLLGAAVLFVYAVAELIQRYGLREIGSWMFFSGACLLIAAFVIDAPMALIRRRLMNKSENGN